MAHITFYEKPGCENNRRQKEWLVLAGHTLEVINILTHPWTKDELRRFFHGKTVPECFNPAAPDIKSGQLDPSGMSMEQAIELMISNPLLIRRPLMEFELSFIQGFDPALLSSIINLEPVRENEPLIKTLKMLDLSSCPRAS
ncbi:MAG TPA: ArsC/Spx/MgsR family protein [Chlorobaculum sp.]|nr:ArsC/Spx/MgsR family protein [Chlorobaculum sp.]